LSEEHIGELRIMRQLYGVVDQLHVCMLLGCSSLSMDNKEGLTYVISHAYGQVRVDGSIVLHFADDLNEPFDDVRALSFVLQ
jgi:hypothetical protein